MQISIRQGGTEDWAYNCVQDVFVDVWNRKNSLVLTASIQAYLRKAVVYKTIDFIRSKKHTFTPIDQIDVPTSASITDSIEAEELRLKIHSLIDELPTRCRLIFVLSRFEHLSHKEISQELDISTKTIENQITKALKHLRKGLQ